MDRHGQMDPDMDMDVFPYRMEFIHQGIQKHRQMMRYIPTSCPFIMKSFESATKNFIEQNLWFGLTLKREKRLEQEEMVSFLGRIRNGSGTATARAVP